MRCLVSLEPGSDTCDVVTLVGVLIPQRPRGHFIKATSSHPRHTRVCLGWSAPPPAPARTPCWCCARVAWPTWRSARAPPSSHSNSKKFTVLPFRKSGIEDPEYHCCTEYSEANTKSQKVSRVSLSDSATRRREGTSLLLLLLLLLLLEILLPLLLHSPACGSPNAGDSAAASAILLRSLCLSVSLCCSACSSAEGRAQEAAAPRWTESRSQGGRAAGRQGGRAAGRQGGRAAGRQALCYGRPSLARLLAGGRWTVDRARQRDTRRGRLN